MRWLVDTNVLLRSVQPTDPMHADAARSVSILRSRRDELQITTQNLIEFWAVCTRPVANNGLGLTIVQAEAEVTGLREVFAFLPGIPDILSEWEADFKRYNEITVVNPQNVS